MHSILNNINLDLFCEALRITDKEPLKILDYGCGDGTLLKALRPRVQQDTLLCGYDLNADKIEQAKAQNIPNCEFFTGAVDEELPIIMKTTDICIMSRVFHEIVEQNRVEMTLAEIHRVMQGFGTLAIVEFKKQVKAPFGPDLKTKLSPGAVERLVILQGFRHKEVYDLGPYFYMTTFGLAGRAGILG